MTSSGFRPCLFSSLQRTSWWAHPRSSWCSRASQTSSPPRWWWKENTSSSAGSCSSWRYAWDRSCAFLFWSKNPLNETWARLKESASSIAQSLMINWAVFFFVSIHTEVWYPTWRDKAAVWCQHSWLQRRPQLQWLTGGPQSGELVTDVQQRMWFFQNLFRDMNTKKWNVQNRLLLSTVPVCVARIVSHRYCVMHWDFFNFQFQGWEKIPNDKTLVSFFARASGQEWLFADLKKEVVQSVIKVRK